MSGLFSGSVLTLGMRSRSFSSSRNRARFSRAKAMALLSLMVRTSIGDRGSRARMPPAVGAQHKTGGRTSRGPALSSLSK